MHYLLHGEDDDPTTHFVGDNKSDTSHEHPESPPKHMDLTDPLDLFNGSPPENVNTNNPHLMRVSIRYVPYYNPKMKLDPDHLKIALVARKASLPYSPSPLLI
jgi:hypothetical protein